jgi:hypothetical protein
MLRKRIFLIILIILSVLTIASSVFILSIDNGKTSIGINIIRLADGTSMVIDQGYGYSYIFPADWYPMAVPISSNDVDNLDKLLLVNNNKPQKEKINDLLQLPEKPGRIISIYLKGSNISGQEIGEVYFDLSRYTPDGIIEPFMDMIKASGIVQSTQVINNSGNDIGIVECKIEERKSYSGCKLFTFIHHNKLFIVFGMTEDGNIIPIIRNTIDNLINTIEFSD